MYILLNDKKYVPKVWSKGLVYKKPFGYRVIHQNSLTPCPRQQYAPILNLF